MEWMRENAPTIYGIDQSCKPVHKFNPTRFRELREQYGSKALAKIIKSMENWRPFKSKNKTAYLSAVNWLEREYGDGVKQNGDGNSRKDNSKFTHQQQYTETID